MIFGRFWWLVEWNCCGSWWYLRGSGHHGIADGSDETVAPTSEGLDEAGVVGGIAEGFADLVDGGAEGVVEVYGGVFAPETELEFFTRDDFSGVLEEGGQDFEGLALNLDSFASLPEFTALKVGFEEAERNSGWPLRELRHKLFTSGMSHRNNLVSKIHLF